eukprot:224794_1
MTSLYSKYSNDNEIKITSLSHDTVSYCMSYLDTKTYHTMATICHTFRISSNRPISYHSQSFSLTTSFWKYILSKKNNHSIEKIKSILFKYKLFKKLQINP